MEELLAVVVLGLVCIAFATLAGPRLGIAAPLLLVGLGVAASLVPGVPELEISPEVILSGIIPPLLYAAAVSIPAADFRREFRSISGLSIVLVIISTVLIGFMFHWLIPDLALPWAFALGAIVSPTDAVATGIIKRLGINPRVVTVLEGESMLNDAVALVLLRGAIAAAAVAVSLGGLTLAFLYSVAFAVLVGWAVGRLHLTVRKRIADPVVSTVISFTVPFVASIPADLLGASGLVAAVVAGLTTGRGAARALGPQERVSDANTWRALELVLEGSVYLIMGLELLGVLDEVREKDEGVNRAFWIAAVTIVATLVVRSGFVAPLVWQIHRRALRAERIQPKVTAFRERVDAASSTTVIVLPKKARRWHGFGRNLASRDQMRDRFTKLEADISYLLTQPLGWREGSVIVWAGMRGVVTIAAAQTLPRDTPNRALLVLIAFLVAIGSLMLQGGTMGPVLRWLKPAPGPTEAEIAEESKRLSELIAEPAQEALEQFRASDPVHNRKAERLVWVLARREALLDVRDLGTFSAAVIEAELKRLDAEQIRLEM